MRLWNDSDCRWKVRDALKDASIWRLREKAFRQAFENKIDTWDYQWFFARIVHGGLAIVPNVNLVKNLGYGADATHTVVIDEAFSAIPTSAMVFPLVHDVSFVTDMQYDLKVAAMLTQRNSLIERIIRFCRLIMVRLGCV
jgi:hypothetical protein